MRVMTKKAPGSSMAAAHAPNSSQHLISTSRGPYLIQVSWPLGWNPDGTTDGSSVEDVPVIYLVDGNAYFFTATDVVRRLQFSWGKRAVVIGVGYPVTDSVFSDRRGPDLTPPSREQKIKHPVGRDGKPRKHIRFGGAEDFLNVLTDEIMPFVETRALPAVPIRSMPKVLFGHSFGGLFSLYTLFTRPRLFNTIIAASPSIWWNDCSIVHEQEAAFLGSDEQQLLRSGDRAQKPKLYITYGSYEQYSPKREGEDEDKYEKRRRHALELRMKDNAVELKGRMDASGRFEELWIQEFNAEDHGSAAAVGLQRGIMKVLGEF